MKKVYIRQDKNSSLYDQASIGFDLMGYEIIRFREFPENAMKEDLVIGWISDSHKFLNNINIKIPESIDYPEELRNYFSREIKRIEAISEITFPLFIKPIEHKQFNGRVVKEFKDLIGIRDVPMYTSDIINIETEYAVYVTNDKIAGIKHYKGDPYISLNKRIVEECINNYSNCPASYRIDFGVTDLNKTIVIEVNDGYTSGNYGLPDTVYAKFLLARWEEILNFGDKN